MRSWDKYQTYMRSTAWQRRRQAFIRTTRGTCFCGSINNLHVHHVTYERLGSELDSDLRLVCNMHHDMIHRYHKNSLKNLTLQEATDEFIRLYKVNRLPAKWLTPFEPRATNPVKRVKKEQYKQFLAKKPWKSLTNAQKQIVNKRRYLAEKGVAKRK